MLDAVKQKKSCREGEKRIREPIFNDALNKVSFVNTNSRRQLIDSTRPSVKKGSQKSDDERKVINRVGGEEQRRVREESGKGKKEVGGN